MCGIFLDEEKKYEKINQGRKSAVAEQFLYRFRWQMHFVY
jgi:hypothetical protein